jgi:nucleotide-binding universal stress UspA family protein
MSLFRRILVPVDGSDPANAAVELALRMARDGTISDLVFCNVVDVSADYSEAASAQMLGGAQDLIAGDKAAGAKIVEAAVKAARDAGLDAAGEVLEGNPTNTIVRRARDGGFDLIITGTHGRRGIERMFLGSTAEGILRHTSLPVLTVK